MHYFDFLNIQLTPSLPLSTVFPPGYYQIHFLPNAHLNTRTSNIKHFYHYSTIHFNLYVLKFVLFYKRADNNIKLLHHKIVCLTLFAVIPNTVFHLSCHVTRHHYVTRHYYVTLIKKTHNKLI